MQTLLNQWNNTGASSSAHGCTYEIRNCLYALESNTLYDERYYGAFEIDGENDCYGLLNEDEQVMLIGRTGTKYIDYGVLETNDSHDTVRVCFATIQQKL